jgi:hypothetical protein
VKNKSGKGESEKEKDRKLTPYDASKIVPAPQVVIAHPSSVDDFQTTCVK